MIKAVAYARYSSDNQRAESIDAQLYDIKKWAAQNGYQIIKVYTDEAETGTDDDRDDFLQMIADIQTGMFPDISAVLVHKTDRFARNKWDAAIYKKALSGCNVKVIYVMQPMLNEDTPEAFLMEGIFESLDQYYSLNLGREVMKGMSVNARNCKHNGGKPPLGYDVEKETKTYIINENEAIAVRRIFEMYDNGMSYDSILKTLNAAGFKTKLGNTFSKNSIADILRNEKYLGIYIFNRALHKVKGKRNNRKSKSDNQIIKIPGGMPQIISQDLWDRVQNKIESRRKNMGERARNKAKKEYLLSGKIFCGFCEAAMVGTSKNFTEKKVRYDYYLCGNRDRKHECSAKMIRKDIIERLVLEELESQLLNPKLFPLLSGKIFQGMSNLGNESEKELIYLKAELTKTQTKIENMLNLIEDGAGSIELTQRLAQRESEKTILVQRIQEVERKTKASTITKEMILAQLEKEYEGLKQNAKLTAKSLINKYVQKVIIFENNFEVTFTIILDTDGGGGAYTVVSRNNLKSAKAFNKPFVSAFLSTIFK